ncbi:MAG: 2-hydroxyacid dehydrogenase [Candidatus Pacebacteria bacterium]|jgi:phosphoglycerate dehydrogenase-like enzyme|nr:2-hydroxyacid dehydrogenase [Candidatus Paceibacterota bacterium]
MKIVVLEKIEMTGAQRSRLMALGEVKFFDSSTELECRARVRGVDAAVIDWIDPNPFLEEMNNPSLLALMSTGYAWIDVKRARQAGISISNIPGYATSAVAEHLIGLMFAVARKTLIGDTGIRSGKKDKGYLEGLEMAGRTAGIIGLGNIGQNVAQKLACFGMNAVAYDIKPIDVPIARSVSLEGLLEVSDVVFVCCDLNERSRNMLKLPQLKRLKPRAILISSTWGVLDIDDLVVLLRNKRIFGAGLDVSIEGGGIDLPKELTRLRSVVLTPHIGYNTREAKIRQADICIDNIEKYFAGKPQNIINY